MNDMAAPEEAKKKMQKRMVRVRQDDIDGLLAVAHLPKKPFPFLSEEAILRHDPAKQEEMREFMAYIAALLKKVRDVEEDILEQYRAKGYAEMEVVDDEKAVEYATGVRRAGLCKL